MKCKNPKCGKELTQPEITSWVLCECGELTKVEVDDAAPADEPDAAASGDGLTKAERRAKRKEEAANAAKE